MPQRQCGLILALAETGSPSGNRRQRIVCTSGAMQALKSIEDPVESLKTINADLTERDAEFAKRKAVAELKSNPPESIQALVELSE